jgi:hypothetical protein
MKYFLNKLSLFIFLFITSLGICDIARGWHDETHLSVPKAAGYYKWYNAAGADMAKLKAGTVEKFNHYYNNTSNRKVTPDMALHQVNKYNSPNDTEGHLYGAIIASMSDYIDTTRKGKYAEYHLAFCAHYVADLSQPFHNMSYDDFNRDRHVANDGIVEREVLHNISKIKKNMYEITIRGKSLEEDLAHEIVRIANISRELGSRLKKEKRDMTKEEAYRQLGHSASLFKAILKALEKNRK